MEIKLFIEIIAAILIFYLLMNIFCYSDYEPASIIGEIFKAVCTFIAGGKK